MRMSSMGHDGYGSRTKCAYRSLYDPTPYYVYACMYVYDPVDNYHDMVYIERVTTIGHGGIFLDTTINMWRIQQQTW